MFRFKTDTREEFSSWVRHTQHGIHMAKYYGQDMELVTEVPVSQILCSVHIPSVPVPAVWAGGKLMQHNATQHNTRHPYKHAYKHIGVGTKIRIWEARQGLPEREREVNIGGEELVDIDPAYQVIRTMVHHAATDSVWVALTDSIVRVSCSSQRVLQRILNAHAGLVNSLCFIPPTGDVWSCGGDQFIKVTQKNNNLQSNTHPPSYTQY